jgi:PAS domain-containing protein
VTRTDVQFADLFEGLEEGVYVGLVGDASSTLAANAHLRLMFGLAPESDLALVRPLDPDRFVDEQARGEFLRQLSRDGRVQGYLLRLRRADSSSMWTEITAKAEPEGPGRLRVEAVMRDVTSRKKLQDPARQPAPRRLDPA